MPIFAFLKPFSSAPAVVPRPIMTVLLCGAALLPGFVPGFVQGAAQAQTARSENARSTARTSTIGTSRARAQDVKLGADDVLMITVLRHPELSAEQITVDSAGKIALPESGLIFVAGKTPNQVATEITRRLSRVLVRPQVTVSIRQQRTRSVFVQGRGAVAKPGVYALRAGYRVTEAIAAAGGLQARADEVNATLSRFGQAPISIDIAAIQANPSSASNRTLLPNDVLTLTALEPRRVTVSGDVIKPDVYELRRARRLLDALVAAGGLKQPSRNSRGFLIRQGKRIDLDLLAANEYTDFKANIALQPNDLIMVEGVPPLRVAVDGFVRNPGNFDLERDSGVIQALAQAGGLREGITADQVVAGVRRGNRFLPLDLTRAAFDPQADITLQNNDVVILAEPDIIRVQVTGDVRTPGSLRLPPQSGVQQAIARAGGLSVKPELARISILRPQPDGSQLPLNIDAAALMTARDTRQNAKLRDGDLISVTEVRAAVAIVSGEVVRPGAYELKEGDSVPQLIARAGGPTEAAALTRVTLQRAGQVQTLNVYGALRGGQDNPNLPLQDGDFVVVPRNNNRVSVIQAVNRPGSYAIPENETLTVTGALSLAGGPRDRAAVKEVAVLRPTPQGTRRRIIPLKAIYNGDLTQDIALLPGDIVYVPEVRVKASVLGTVGSILGIAGSARFLGAF